MMKQGTTIVLMLLLVAFSGCGPSKEKRAKESAMRYRIAHDLFYKGDTTQAMSELLKAEKLTPDNPDIQNLLSLAYAQRGMTKEAEKHARMAIKLDPEFSEARNHLCAIMIDEKRYDEAIAECTKSVENVTYATPERPYHNMGIAYERKGDSAKAIESYKKALLHNRNFVLSRRSLASVSYTHLRAHET